MRKLLVSLLVFSFASSSFAARSPVAARKHRDAEEQLMAGDTDAALASVQEGLAAAPGDKELILLRGHVLLRRGEYEDAANDYRAYLAGKPSRHNKRDVQSILESLDQVARTHLVVIVKNGPGEVRLDSRAGRPFCVANPECNKGVIPGDHLVVVDKPGHTRVARRVVVEPATTQTVEVTLVPRGSPLVVKVTPANASVSVDGAPAGNEIAAGEHKVTVAYPMHITQTLVVRASGGEPVTIQAALKPGVPAIVYPKDAHLTVDGEPVEIVDGMLALDPEWVGMHKVVATAPGYHSESAALPAERLNIALRPVGAYLAVNGGPRGAALFIDGSQRENLPLAEPLELDPGDHTVEVRVPGRPPVKRTASLPANKQSTFHVEATRAPRVKAWIAAGVTVAGVVSGAYFGTTALLKQKDYDAEAGKAGVTVNDMKQRALHDDGRRAALISDISFGVGVVAMVASMYWFRTEGRKPAGRIEVAPVAGGVGLSTSF